MPLTKARDGECRVVHEEPIDARPVGYVAQHDPRDGVADPDDGDQKTGVLSAHPVQNRLILEQRQNV